MQRFYDHCEKNTENQGDDLRISVFRSVRELQKDVVTVTGVWRIATIIYGVIEGKIFDIANTRGAKPKSVLVLAIFVREK